jgi:hypothetical protein
VDQRKNKRKEEEEEEAIEVLEEDVSDEESVQEEAESPKRRPADRAWLPKASQKKKRKVEVVPEQADQAGPSNASRAPQTCCAGPSNAISGSDEPTFVSREITEEISNWLVHGLSAEDSKVISKRFEFEFEEKSLSIKLPKLDSFMLRRAKDSNRSKVVGAVEDALIFTQLKIMDISPPLIELYTKICSLGEDEAENEAKSVAKVILQQWGRAFKYISKRRRRSVVSLVDPGFEYLLSQPSAYVPGKEAVELLFTDDFLQSRGSPTVTCTKNFV